MRSNLIFLKSDPLKREGRNFYTLKILQEFIMKSMCLSIACLSIMSAIIILVAKPSPSMAGSCYSTDHEHAAEK